MSHESLSLTSGAQGVAKKLPSTVGKSRLLCLLCTIHYELQMLCSRCVLCLSFRMKKQTYYPALTSEGSLCHKCDSQDQRFHFSLSTQLIAQHPKYPFTALYATTRSYQPKCGVMHCIFFLCSCWRKPPARRISPLR